MTRATSLLALPSSLLTKSSMSCQDISWARIALLPGHPWHEERSEGKSTWGGGGEGEEKEEKEEKEEGSTSLSSGWEKNWKGRLASCWRTDGWRRVSGGVGRKGKGEG